MSGDLCDSITEGEEPWENFIDPMLNHAIWYGKDVSEVARLIRRGEFGMDVISRGGSRFVSRSLELGWHYWKVEHVFDMLT